MKFKRKVNLWRTFNDLHYIRLTTGTKLRLLAPSHSSGMGVFVYSYMGPISSVTEVPYRPWDRSRHHSLR